MKKIIFIYLLLFSNNLLSQNKINYDNYEHTFGVQFTTGLSSFNLNEAQEFFKQMIDYYNQLGVPLQLQRNYPVNILWGGYIYYFPDREFSLTLGAEFTGTKAYSLYGDYAGFIDLKSYIKMLNVNFALKKHFMEIIPLQPFLGLEVGLLAADYNFDIITNFSDIAQISYKNSLKYSQIGYHIEGFVGFSYNLKYFIIDLQGGYKYSVIPSPERGDLSERSLYMEEPFDLNVSGLILKFSIRTGIYW